jgi:hypothetical protein
MSIVAEQIHPTVAAPKMVQRLDALDWTKGFLVILMVVYHAINYSAFRPLAFKHLAFLPSSFIFITGFLVAQVYTIKYDLSTWKPYLRLAVRGARLLALFLFLNVCYRILHARDFLDGLEDFADRAGSILISGNGREGIFEVLLPISYFLLLAPALLWLRSRAAWAITIVAAVIFILCLELERSGHFSKNLSLLSAGFLGMAVGQVPQDWVRRFARQWTMVLGSYIAYRLSTYLLGEIYPVQMLGAFATLGLIFWLASHLDSEFWPNRQMFFLGKYTLLGYLLQIPLIQLLVFRGKPGNWGGVIVVILAATFIEYFVILGIHRSRKRFWLAEKTYGLIFG